MDLCYRLALVILSSKIGENFIVGTTKLTRKEILAEDPVHQMMIQLVELFRKQGKLIAIVAACAALIALGVHFGLQFLDSRDLQAQRQLSKAIDFFHAQIDSGALDDPYGKGPEPIFRTEAAKYQAAAKELSTFISKHGSSKLGIIARYYQGLTQLRLGQNNEAIQSLEVVRSNTKERTLSYLAKKVLAKCYLGSGNLKMAREIIDGMLKDPQCMLPKEDLKLELSRILSAEGKRDEAIKLLREARMQSGRSMLQSLLMQELNRLEGASGPPPASPETSPVTVSMRP